jgi:hypothetical protein
MYLRDRVPNYIIKHKDNLKVAPLKLLRNLWYDDSDSLKQNL